MKQDICPTVFQVDLSRKAKNKSSFVNLSLNIFSIISRFAQNTLEKFLNQLVSQIYSKQFLSSSMKELANYSTL